MPKRKEDAPAPGAPAWMATFGDLMNLLLCFFVLLFSMSSVDVEKYELVVASFSDTFGIFSDGSTALGEGVLIGNGVSQLNELDQYFNSMGKAAEGDVTNDDSIDNTSDTITNTNTNTEDVQELIDVLEAEKLQESEALAEKISEAVSENNLDGEIDIDFTSEYVSLTLKGTFVFTSGSADIKKEAYTTLDKVGMILEKYGKSIIEIEGHTDNVPISNSQFANNNELSSFRALAVFDYLLINSNLDPAKLKHSGRGEYVPIADNSTESGRAINRRVEIKIYHMLSSYQ